MPEAAPFLLAFGVIAAAFHGIAWLDVARDPVQPFLALFLVASAAFVALAVHVYRRPPRSRGALVGILVGGALLRLVAWSSPYVLETDIHRYLWDGYVLSKGFNPYQFSPREVAEARRPEGNPHLSARDQALARELFLHSRDERIRGVFRRINAPDLPTCYPPLTELAFGLTAAAFPGSARAWKLVVVLLDLAICGLILLLLRRLGREPAWVLFYAWCPLVLKEYANTGHFDPLATLPALLGVYWLLEERPTLAGAALGAGIAAKLYPAVLAALFARRLGLRGVLPALVVPLLLASPFLGIGLEVLEGLGAFAARWEFNSSLFTLLWALLGWSREVWVTVPLGGRELALTGFHIARLLSGALFLALLAALWRWEEEADWSIPARAGLALGGLFLLSPVADPWYLPWILPYACLFPLPSVLYLSVSVCCYYLYFLGWQDVWWYRVVEYCPFFLLLARDLSKKSSNPKGRLPEPHATDSPPSR